MSVKTRCTVLAAMTATAVLTAGNAGAAVGAPVLPAGCSQPSANGPVTCIFGYTGDEQTFAVPTGVTTLDVVVAGASAANRFDGDKVTGTIAVPPGTSTLYVEVGGPGQAGQSSGKGGAGGFNGGGNGGSILVAGATWPGGDGGSGASDIRVLPRSVPITTTADPRLVVAGGAGGNGAFGHDDDGGPAGRDGKGVGGRAGASTSEVGGAGVDSDVWDYTAGGGGGGGLVGGAGGGVTGPWIVLPADGGGGGGTSKRPPGGTSALAYAGASVHITYQPVGPVVASLVLAPDRSAVAVGTPVQYSVSGVNAEGAIVDVTGDAVLSITGGSCSANICTSSKAGQQTVTARHQSTNAVGQLTATAIQNVMPGPPALLTAAGGGQSAVPGATFASALSARVTDTYGNPISDVAVTFAIQSGGASFGGSTEVTVTSGADGLATAPALSAGTRTGPVSVRVGALGLPDATMNLTVAAPPAVPTTPAPTTPASTARALQDPAVAAAVPAPSGASPAGLATTGASFGTGFWLAGLLVSSGFLLACAGRPRRRRRQR